MILSCSINVFDGAELIPFLIKPIRNHVDIIIINFQNYSYYGNKASDSDLEIVNELYRKGLADKIHNYKSKTFAKDPSEAKILEKEKRNQGKEFCRLLGATHHLELDCDEGFKEEEFIKAKNYFIKCNLEFSAVKYVNYFHKPIYQEVTEIESHNVIPFICKIEEGKDLGTGSFLGNSDPTRSYMLEPHRMQYLFNREEIQMHHYSGIRKSLENKFNNTSYVHLDRNKIPELINNIQSISESNLSLTNSGNFNMLSKKYKVVDNYFGIEV